MRDSPQTYGTPIIVSVSRSVATRVRPTPETTAIAGQFGIGSDEEHRITLYHDLKIPLGPGRVIYITGESGAGKSSLLRDLAAAGMQAGFSQIQVLEERDLPLVNLFMSLQEAVEMLTRSGISEPFVWLRTPREVSDGQRYRLQIALIMAASRGAVRPLIVLDEFLANLDRETARAVAHQVRKAADAYGICFVVATTHTDIEEDLNPNTRVLLRLNVPPELKGRVV